MAQPPRRNLFYLGWFAFGHFSVDTPGGALWILAPTIGLAWGLSPAEVGFIIAAHGLGGGLGYIPAGLMGDRYRRRGLLMLLTVWWVVFGYLAASAAPGYWTLVALLALASVGDAAWHPMATGTMVEQMPKRRALALGVHLSGGIMAEVIGPLAAGFLLAVLDWREVLRIAVVPSVLMGIGFLFFHRGVPSIGEGAITKADLRHIVEVWGRPAGLGMFAVGVTYNMAFLGLLAMAPLFFQDYHGYSSAWAGSVIAAMWLGGGLAAPLVGRLSDGVGRKRVIVLSMLGGAAGAGVAAVAGNAVVLVVAAVFAATLLVGARPVLLAAAVEMVGRRAVTSLGLIYAVMDGVGALGALLAGLAGTSDLRYSFAFVAGAAVLASAMAAAHPFAVDSTSRRSLASDEASERTGA